MSTKADAETILDIIMAHNLGHTFTQASLIKECQSLGHKFSSGAISGVLTRTQTKGFVIHTGYRREGGLNRKVKIYQLVEKGDWAHKPKSHGSYPGRDVDRQRIVDTMTELAETLKQEEAAGENYYNKEPEKAVKPSDFAGLPIYEPDDETIKDQIISDLIKSSEPEVKKSINLDTMFTYGSLGYQLLQLAVEVHDLETTPVKKLKDFTTDELLEELKRRIHE